LEASRLPEVRTELHNAGLNTLVAVDERHYEPVRLAMEQRRQRIR